MLRFLVFRLGEATYALPADKVREIVSDLPCFPVPFTPEWVPGVLNRQGVPYTILDLQILLAGIATPPQVHLLLNTEADRVAIAISEVREILQLPPDRFRRLVSQEGEQVYFKGALALDQGDVFVLEIDEVLKKLAHDVQSA